METKTLVRVSRDDFFYDDKAYQALSVALAYRAAIRLPLRGLVGQYQLNKAAHHFLRVQMRHEALRAVKLARYNAAARLGVAL